MTDYSELKRLAEAANDTAQHYISHSIAVGHFTSAANPTAVLALIAENEALRKDAERLVFCTSHPELQFFQGESGWGVMDCEDGLSIPFKDAESLRSAIDRMKSKEG